MSTLNVPRAVVAVVAVTEARAEAVAPVVAAAGDVVPLMAPHPPPSMSMTRLPSLLSRRLTPPTIHNECSLVLFFSHCAGYGLV